MSRPIATGTFAVRAGAGVFGLFCMSVACAWPNPLVLTGVAAAFVVAVFPYRRLGRRAPSDVEEVADSGQAEEPTVEPLVTDGGVYYVEPDVETPGATR